MNVTYSYIPIQKTFERCFFLKRSIIRSNSDTDLFRLIQQSNKSLYEDRTECNNLEQVIGNPKHYPKKTRQARMFFKGKNRLSEFIQAYSRDLKLIGNKRYNEYNPFLFVKDQKQKVSLTTIGLFPVPLKSQRKVNSMDEMNLYKNIQRSIVSMRRIQYAKNKQAQDTHQKKLERDKDKSKDRIRDGSRLNSKAHSYDTEAIIRIQQWWKLMSKIIKIQKYYRQQKEKQAVKRFKLIMNNLDDCLNIIKAKSYFQVLKHFHLLKRVCLSQYNITKEIKPDVEKVIKIQSQLRSQQSKTGKDTLNEEDKNDKRILTKCINKNSSQYSLITKCTQTQIKKIRAAVLVNRLIRKYKTHIKKTMIIEKELLLPMLSFKTNIILPSLTSKLISDNVKQYAKRQRALQKPISVFDMQKIHYSKGKHTYTSKDAMKFCDKDKDSKMTDDNARGAPLYQYENFVSYISKKRYRDNNVFVLLLQRKITQRLYYLKNKDNKAICFIEKVYLSINTQTMMQFCFRLNEIMKRGYWIKRTKPLLNKYYINRAWNNNTDKSNKYHLNDDEMDHVLFLQQQYQYWSSKAKSNSKPIYTINETDSNDKTISYISIIRITNRIQSIIKLQRIAKVDRRKAIATQAQIVHLPIINQAFISKEAFIANLHSNNNDNDINRRILRSKGGIKANDETETTIHPLTNYCFITINRFNSRVRVDKCKAIIGNYLSKTIYRFKKPSLLIDSKNGNQMYHNLIIKKDLALQYYLSKICVQYINREHQEDLNIQQLKIINKTKCSTDIDNTIKIDNDNNTTIHREQYISNYLLCENTNSNNAFAYYMSKQRKTDSNESVSLIQTRYKKSKSNITMSKAKAKAKASYAICFFTKRRIRNDNNRNMIAINRIQNAFRKRLSSQSNNYTHNSNVITFRSKPLGQVMTKRKRAQITKITKCGIIKPIVNIQKAYKNRSKSKNKNKNNNNNKSTINLKPQLNYSFTSKQTINSTHQINAIIKIQSVYRSFIYQKAFYRNLDKMQFDKFSLQYIPKKQKTKLMRPSLNQAFIIKIQKRVIQNPNMKFVSLINLFATKNTQEFIFPILFINGSNHNTKIMSHTKNTSHSTFWVNSDKNNDINSYPYYLNTIDRHLKFNKSSQSNESKVKQTLKEIFPNYTPSTKIVDEVLLLNTPMNQSKENKLWSYNIYDQIDKDLLNYLNAFCVFDKKFNNPKFIKERLKQIKLNNTSIFGLTKHIDSEYSNLIKGVFCFQCYYSADSCECMTINNNDEDDAQYEIEDKSNDDHYSIRNSINHFDYENICQGVILKRKPKIDEGFGEGITQIVIVSEEREDKDSHYQSEENKEMEKAIEKNSPSMSNRYDAIYRQSKKINEARKSLNPIRDNSKKTIKLRDEAHYDEI